MQQLFEMCTFCGLTKSPIAPNIYVLQTTKPAQILGASVQLHCTQQQLKPLTICTACFNDMLPVPLPASTAS